MYFIYLFFFYRFILFYPVFNYDFFANWDFSRRCLLSRKRKLSELYFATVGIAGATEGTPTDSRYRQNEQAFLDANDLTKYVPSLHYSLDLLYIGFIYFYLFILPSLLLLSSLSRSTNNPLEVATLTNPPYHLFPTMPLSHLTL